MVDQVPHVSEDIKIMASIGHVCLQWARLEMALLGIIYTIEDMPIQKGEIIFGGLDINPRCNMAVSLGDYHKLPLRFMKRMRAVRSTLQKGLADERNQIVHGAHREMENGSTTLTMVRWRGEKRDKTFTALDIHNVGVKVMELADECWSIMNEIGDWKYRSYHESHKDGPSD